MKIEEINQRFLATKKLAIQGEEISSGVIQLIKDIDSLLNKFQAIDASEETKVAMEMALGENTMDYARNVAMVLGEAKMKIEALG